MKRWLHAIGGACFYFGIYLMAQVAVGYVFVLGVIGMAMLREAGQNANGFLGLLENEAAFEQVQQDATNWMLAHTTEMLIVSLAVTIFFAWLAYAVRGRSLFAAVKCRGIDLKTAASGVCMGICVSCAVQVIFSLIPFPEEWVEAYLESSSSLTETPFWILAIAALLLAPFVEELIFRGLIYTHLREVMPIPVACVLVSTLFGIMHGTLLWFLYTFFLSLLLVAAYERTQSLLTPILIHFGFNLCGTFLGYLIGEEISLLEMILLALVGLLGTAGLTVWMFFAKKKSLAEAFSESTIQSP